jgi:hypothetical protein
MLTDCRCKAQAEPRTTHHLTLDELDALLDKEPVVEYRYFNKFGYKKVVKIIHCRRCQYLETHLNRNMKKYLD